MFGGPGRAIIRNALVVAIGFLPLLTAPLVPYKTVGFFMFAIMAISSFATLFIIPAIISLFPAIITPKSHEKVICKRGYCMLIALFVASAVAYILFGYSMLKWQPVTFILIGIIVIFAGFCHLVSKHKGCLDLKG